MHGRTITVGTGTHRKRVDTAAGRGTRWGGYSHHLALGERWPSALSTTRSEALHTVWQGEKENGTSPAFTKFFQHDIELRLQCIVFDWLHRQRASHSCAMLQYRISQELEDYDSMTNEPRQNHEDVEITRRAALRHLGVFRK